MQAVSDIGLVGLAVMGENLALNMENKGFHISAKVADGTPCCDWGGDGGAGHFVKMVHNGIEYGDIHLIRECYQIMKDVLGMTNEEMHGVFAEWNRGDQDSYLIEITRAIKFTGDRKAFLDDLQKALFAAKVVSYAQGFALMRSASAALAYYDGYRCERLPANMLQAQRDYFGAHTYERTDRPRGEFFHTNWTGHGGDTVSGTYTV